MIIRYFLYTRLEVKPAAALIRIDLERLIGWWQRRVKELFVQTLLNSSHTVVFLTPVKVLTAPSGSVRTSAVISGLRSEPGTKPPLSSIWEYSYDSIQKSIPFTCFSCCSQDRLVVAKRLQMQSCEQKPGALNPQTGFFQCPGPCLGMGKPQRHDHKSLIKITK